MHGWELICAGTNLQKYLPNEKFDVFRNGQYLSLVVYGPGSCKKGVLKKYKLTF